MNAPVLKVVYELRRELDGDPEHVAIVQALTLNKEKPLLGLKGTHGLFGSDEWWNNIQRGKLKRKILSGVIRELVFAGQDSRWGNQVNSFRLAGDDGVIHLMSIQAHDKSDRKLFCVGARVAATYVLDELKKSSSLPFGAKEFSEILLELAVSRVPTAAQQGVQGSTSPPSAGPRP